MRLHLLPALLLGSCTTSERPEAPPDAVLLTGTATWEGHFERPHATRTIAVSVHLSTSGERARVELEETWAPEREPQRTVIAQDGRGCWTLAPGSTRAEADPGEAARLVRLLVAATRDGDLEPHTIVWQHPRLGDVEDSVAWQPAGGAPELHLVWHRAHDRAELRLRLGSAAVSPRLDAPTFGAGTTSLPTPPRSAPARFATIAPGVHELVLPDASTRSLAVEFSDHVVLCETSVDNGAGERLLAALDRHLPGKPVRWVLFGHYHPHYTGGLRPVLARGATVLAPPLGAAFAAEIAARSFASRPDALAASGRAPAIETFHGQRLFRDATNELLAVDIGTESRHTDEYVVFHLPRQRLLFQGDLGWFAGPAGPRAGGDRARGLVGAIDARGLDVETLVQGWPAHGRGTLPLADLRALLAR